jgi:hypothetical protein
VYISEGDVDEVNWLALVDASAVVTGFTRSHKQ